ncbi:MAG: hypothetical protein R3C16_09090 [Hyphomonadaceae bacterium]
MQTLRFMAPVRIGDTVDATVEVVELTEIAGAASSSASAAWAIPWCWKAKRK